LVEQCLNEGQVKVSQKKKESEFLSKKMNEYTGHIRHLEVIPKFLNYVIF